MAYTTVNKSSDYFNTKLYTGNGGTQSITGVGFQPDWVWIKSRTTGGYHNVFDAVRGVTKRIFTNDTQAENTSAATLTAFGSDGFSVGSNGDVNGNSQSQVAWNWLANGAGSANTDGSISSTVSANTTSGFSIVSWTGNGSAATVGHGLGSAPKVVIIKSRDNAHAWFVGHQSLDASAPWTKYMTLENSNAINDDIIWNDTAPTSSLFSVGNYSSTNGSGVKFIGYCFAEKQGFSKFGSYTGNGNADGTFVYTGFKPAWVMTKKTSGTSSWDMHDTKRDTFNVATKHLLAEDAGAEGSTVVLDILSNGFKFRTSNGDRNASGATYIYMAFAEAPLVGSNNVPCTAR